MKKIVLTASVAAAFALTALPSLANIIFTFSEVGGNVVMNSSGVLNTTNLVQQASVSGWGGTGIEENGNHDIMGGTGAGSVDISFGFHTGTNYSQWVSANGPWSASNFSASFTGTTGFTTYIRPVGNSAQTPGIGVERSDIIGGLWTPNQNWMFSNQSFASLQMHVGTYTVSDSLTHETITFQIGNGNAVPEPGSIALFGLGLAGFIASRRRSGKARTA